QNPGPRRQKHHVPPARARSSDRPSERGGVTRLYGLVPNSCRSNGGISTFGAGSMAPGLTPKRTSAIPTRHSPLSEAAWGRGKRIPRLGTPSDAVQFSTCRTCPWRIPAHAAIGVWYRPRQCFCQRYDLKLIALDCGASTGVCPSRPCEFGTAEPWQTLAST